MWMMNNPVVLVRAALDAATKVSAGRAERGMNVYDLVLKEGDTLSMALDARSNLPAWVRWSNPHNNLGQVTYTTYFTGYAPFGGVMLPLGYRTLIDWRDVEYFKIYVDNYTVDDAIADLAAPAAVRSAPEPPVNVAEVKATAVAPGIWRLTPGGTTVFEFADHLTLYELGGSPRQGKAIIEFARTLVPGKPVTQVITSHAHFDHVAGLRAAIAEGLTVIARRGNEVIYREMAAHPAPDYPDDLWRRKAQLKFMPVDEHLRLSDAQMTVDVYWGRGNIHMADAVFAYVPAAKVMVEGDMATAAQEWQWWGDSYMDNIEHYKLDVEILSPVHMNVMKQADVIQMIRAGVERARTRCAQELAKGNYFAGCPVQSKRY
jgi:glyoxylase-like metal-dependent hydrolase (beta-lactamase superfamily II)